MSPGKSLMFPRPAEGDCPEYFFRYISLVPEVDILTLLHTQRDWYGDFIESLTPEQAEYRYAPGKWSLAEMIGHVLDTEYIFAYRMLAISRGDISKLPGFEQDDYIANSIFHEITPSELAHQWRAFRSSSIYIARHMNTEMASRTGIANENPIRAFAYPYIMAGHVIHHYSVARESYLSHVIT